MFRLPLSQRLIRWILPPSPEPLSISGNDNNTAIGTFAPELLDQIIDHLHNDRPTLLHLGLISRQTLIRSRFHLFSELEFNPHNGGDRKFDMFLALLDISKLRKILSSVVSSQNALQTVVGVMNWSPYFRSAHNARYR